MKILFINRLLGTAIGGGENFVLNLLEEMQKRDHEVFILTARPIFKRGSGFNIQGQVSCLKLPFLRYIGFKYHFPFPWILTWIDEAIFNWAAFLWVVFFLRRQKIDVVQITVFPNLACRIEKYLKLPVIGRVAGLPDQKFALKLKKISAVIANGDAYIQLKKFGLKKCFEIQPGVREAFFKNIPQADLKKLRESFCFSVDSLVILFVGRRNKLKNLPVLLKVFAEVEKRIKSACLLIVGAGDQKKHLERISIELNITKRVIFAGEKRRDEIIPYYQMSDIFVLPSRYDNFPQVVNEAMASGLPVIATKVGGMPMQIKAGVDGFLVEVNDVAGLANRIIQLAESPDLRKRMGDAGRKKAEKEYSWQKSAEVFEKLCYNILR